MWNRIEISEITKHIRNFNDQVKATPGDKVLFVLERVKTSDK